MVVKIHINFFNNINNHFYKERKMFKLFWSIFFSVLLGGLTLITTACGSGSSSGGSVNRGTAMTLGENGTGSFLGNCNLNSGACNITQQLFTVNTGAIISNKQGNFIAVGGGGGSKLSHSIPAISVSANGSTWSNAAQYPVTISGGLNAITIGNDGKYITVGDAGIFTSNDGNHWQNNTPNGIFGSAFSSVAISNNNMAVAVGGSGIIAYSNGVSAWQVINHSVTDQDLNKVVVNSKGVFVAVGDNGTIITSSNGSNWQTATLQTATTANFNSIAVSGNIFVAVGSASSATQTVYTSTDGMNWTAGMTTGSTPVAITNNLSDVAVNSQGQFVIVGTAGPIYYSTNGTSWGTNAIAAANLVAVTATPQGNFIAVGNNGTVLNISNNDWSASSITVPQVTGLNVLSITVSATGTYLITSASSQQDIGPIVYSANNGTTWNLINNGMPAYELSDMTANAQGILVAVGESGLILTSSNKGSTWSNVSNSSYTNNLTAVTKSNNQFVAVGAAGTVLQSTDGTNWTAPSNLPGNDDLYSIATNLQGMMVAVGKAGTVWVNNGTAWSAATNQNVTADNLNSVTINSAGTWIAGGDNGTIIYSKDGNNWSLASTSTTFKINKVLCTKTYCVASASSDTMNAPSVMLSSTDNIHWNVVAYDNLGWFDIIGIDALTGEVVASDVDITTSFTLVSSIYTSGNGNSWSNLGLNLGNNTYYKII